MSKNNIIFAKICVDGLGLLWGGSWRSRGKRISNTFCDKL